MCFAAVISQCTLPMCENDTHSSLDIDELLIDHDHELARKEAVACIRSSVHACLQILYTNKWSVSFLHHLKYTASPLSLSLSLYLITLLFRMCNCMLSLCLTSVQCAWLTIRPTSHRLVQREQWPCLPCELTTRHSAGQSTPPSPHVLNLHSG